MFNFQERSAQREREIGGVISPQAGQHILDRARSLGADTPASARTREDLNARRDPAWDELLACGYLHEARDGYYYLAHADGSADRMFGGWTPARVIAAVAAVAVLGYTIAKLAAKS
jgi:hypothetical protein